MKTSIRCVALSVVLAAAGQAAAQSTLKSVSVDKSGPGVQVMIKGKNLRKPTERWDKGTLNLDFSARVNGRFPFQNVKDDGLISVAVWRHRTENPRVRVALKTDGKAKPNISQTPEGWLVQFGAADPVAANQSEPIAKATVAEAKPKADPFGMPSFEPSLNVLEKMGVPSSNKVEPIVSKPKSVVSAPKTQPNSQPLAPKTFVFTKETEPAPHENLPAKTSGEEIWGKNRVSLEFINTEIVQILKALAMQAGINIVTAPEVKGTLTVSMQDVTVKHALDMVTTVASLRYQQVGNSFVVTTPDKFNNAISELTGKRSTMMATRVVPIHSGAGREIRASVLTSMSNNPAFGQYQIFLPEENYKIEKSKSTGPQGESSQTGVSIESGKTGGNKSAEDESGALSVKALKEQYLVLVGPDAAIDEVEERITMLDRAIAKAYGYDVSSSSKLVRQSYIVQSPDVTASSLVKSLSQADSSFLNVDMYATPKTFQNQVVVLVGREAEVKRAEAMLRDLDYSGYGSNVFMYEVKFSDPRSLREELVAHVKGLRVTIPAASAATPRLYDPGRVAKDAGQRVSHTGMITLNGENQVAQSEAPKAGATDTNSKTLNSPFEKFETIAVPMRLTLTGTTEQIRQAQAYLAQVDVAPKQIALELRVMELSKEDALRFGLNWDLTTGGSVRSLGSSLPLPDGRTISGSVRDGAFGIDVTATLDQIANKDNLIARPNLLAVDGRESEIFVGDIIRYIESIQSTQNGVTVITDEVPVGVRLAVIPRVGDGFITLDLRPVVSFLTGFTPVPGGGQLPQTSVRMSQSTVTLRSGETIALGGLIQDQELKRLSKVPILGDLPVLGFLFRQTERTRERRELVFFLTAREVGPEDRQFAASPRHNAAKNPPEITPGHGSPVNGRKP